MPPEFIAQRKNITIQMLIVFVSPTPDQQGCNYHSRSFPTRTLSVYFFEKRCLRILLTYFICTKFLKNYFKQFRDIDGCEWILAPIKKNFGKSGPLKMIFIFVSFLFVMMVLASGIGFASLARVV